MRALLWSATVFQASLVGLRLGQADYGQAALNSAGLAVLAFFWALHAREDLP